MFRVADQKTKKIIKNMESISIFLNPPEKNVQDLFEVLKIVFEVFNVEPEILEYF